jgi:hypothetical protein
MESYKDQIKKLTASLFPYFMVFIIGDFIGSASVIHSIEKDCNLMNKTRIAERVYSCEKK